MGSTQPQRQIPRSGNATHADGVAVVAAPISDRRQRACQECTREAFNTGQPLASAGNSQASPANPPPEARLP